MAPSECLSKPICFGQLRSSNLLRLQLDRRRLVSTYGYAQAKALVYSKHGEPRDVLSLHKHSISPPHSNLLTLRTLAAPINPADINQIQGTYPALPPFSSTLGTPSPSAVPGSEAVFEVLSTGGQVKTAARGDWVIPRSVGLGTWRTHLQIPEDRIQRIEKAGLAPFDAATVTVNPVTAHRLLSDFAIPPLDPATDWLVQNGANSGVGRMVVQLARLRGIRNVAVVRERADATATEALRAELRELGATHVVTEAELQERGFSERIKEWTDGGRERVRLALNCVGGKPGVALAKVLSPGCGAQHVTYGAMARQPLQLPASMLIFRDVAFRGFWVSKWAEGRPEERVRVVGELLDLVRNGELKGVPVDEVRWADGTSRDELVDRVQGTLEGFRKGKGVFNFEGD